MAFYLAVPTEKGETPNSELTPRTARWFEKKRSDAENHIIGAEAEKDRLRYYRWPATPPLAALGGLFLGPRCNVIGYFSEKNPFSSPEILNSPPSRRSRPTIVPWTPQ